MSKNRFIYASFRNFQRDTSLHKTKFIKDEFERINCIIQILPAIQIERNPALIDFKVYFSPLTALGMLWSDIP